MATKSRKGKGTSKSKGSQTGSPKKGAKPGSKLAQRRRSPAAIHEEIDDKSPVSLEEARALVRAAAPTRTVAPARAIRRAAAPVEQPVALELFGEERERLIDQRNKERAQQLRDYQATMAIMKQRGVKKAQPASGGAGRRRALSADAGSFQPLQVMAEGDSWFEYPVPFFGGGIVPRLEKRLGVPILNMAAAGDEVRFMLGVEQRKRLQQNLQSGCPAGGPWDVVLFSGGGNDIVDNPMALWIRDFQQGASPGSLINQPRFDSALGIVRAGYEDLIAMRDTFSPTTQLVFHCYDFAIPDGRGICGHGPWLKPALDLHRITQPVTAAAVVKEMLLQFKGMLDSLSAAHPGKITIISTQGTLDPKPSSWHNELHPQSKGFDQFAGMFRDALKTLFPNRVI